jgi:DNA-binding transcriptional LysR family regulator
VFRHYQQDADPEPPGTGEEGARGRLLLDEPVYLVTPADETATGEVTEPDLAMYAKYRWIAGCERCRGYLVRQCGLAGFTPKIAFTTDDYVAVQALVAAGLGVTTLPGLCLRAARHPGICAVPLPGARRHVFAMTYGEPPDPPATSRLIDVLAAAAEAPSLVT